MYEFAGRFNRKDLFIKEFNYWTLLLMPVPITIGSCIILLKRQCNSIASLTDEEMIEFRVVCKYFENKCKKLYGAIKFNYHANMMKESFVHFKAIPRYDKSVKKHGVEWIDCDYPRTEPLTKNKIEDKLLYEIRKDFLEDD